jgi:TonB family protein
MITTRLLENLIAYSAQVAVIIAAGAVIVAVARVRAPRVRYAWWRGLLAAALVLPLFYDAVPTPAAARTPAPAATGPGAPAMAVPVSTIAADTSGPATIDWTSIVFGLLAAGVACRLSWTALGLWKLKRLRQAGVDVTADYRALQELVGASAEIRSDRVVGQPVTFGIWRPVVMLPAALFEQSEDIQQAVVCHELLHVRRRDWPWLVTEELLRAVLWFHPAVWWGLSQIQSTREEVVDAAVVRITGERRAYAEALVAFAEAAVLTPVAAFSRRHHLVRRILLISQEGSMSPVRIIVSCVVVVAAAGASSWYGAWAFPLQVNAPVTAPRPGVVAQPTLADAIGPLERQAKPVTAENPVPRRTYAVSPQYPVAAGNVRGVLMLRATLDAQGRVAELRSLRGSSTDAVYRAFAAAAMEAVRQWQFEPPFAAPISFDVSVAFAPENGTASSNITPRPVAEFAPRYDEAKQAYQRLLMANESARAGQAAAPSETELRTARERLLAIERELEERSRGARAGVRQDAPVRVGGAVLAPTKTKHVAPIYPEEAKAAGVQGVVIAEVRITAEGGVEDVRMLRSIPLLDQAAIDAIRQWEFTPTLLNGSPIAVIMTVTVQFTLDGQF